MIPIDHACSLVKSLGSHLDCKARLDLTTLRGFDLNGCSACPNHPSSPEPAVSWQFWDENFDCVGNYRGSLSPSYFAHWMKRPVDWEWGSSVTTLIIYSPSGA